MNRVAIGSHRKGIAVATIALISVVAQSGYSGPSSCPYCENDFSMCGGLGVMHQFVGTWPYDGHNGYHGGYSCGSCDSVHPRCTIAALEAADSIKSGLDSNRNLKATLVAFKHVVTYDERSSVITVKDCQGEVAATFALKRHQRQLVI